MYVSGLFEIHILSIKTGQDFKAKALHHLVTIRSLATILTAAMYIFFSISECGLPVEIAARCNLGQNQDRHFAGPFGL